MSYQTTVRGPIMSHKCQPVISRTTLEDLPELVKQARIANGFYSGIEDITMPEEERCRNQIHRYAHSLLQDSVIAMCARDPDTGDFMGFAMWHKPGYKAKGPPDPVGMTGGNRETQEDIDAWKGMDVEWISGFWKANDEARERLMDDEPHFYLAPLFTAEKHRRKGVATALLKHQMASADEPLTAFVNKKKPWARAMYEGAGWRDEGDHGNYTLMVWRKEA